MAGTPLQFELVGGNMQALRFTLQPGQVLIGEAGCMLFMDDGISFECRMADGSTMQNNESWWSTMKAGFQRFMTSESLFFTWFMNRQSVPRQMAVAIPKVGTIVPLNLHQLPGSAVIAESGAYLCSSVGVRVSIELVKRLGAGLFGGEGFILQRIAAEPGSAGQVWLHGGGQIVRKELNNEELTIDTGALFAMTVGLQYEVETGGWGNALKGGQLFLAKIRGTGTVWVQSTPFNRIAQLIIAAIPVKQEKKD